MATVAVTVFHPPRLRSKLFTYTGNVVANTNDVGAAVEVLGYSSILCTAIIGTAGSGATLEWQGSHDGSNWFTFASAVTPTALNMTATLSVPPRYVRPKLTGGTTTVLNNVNILAR